MTLVGITFTICKDFVVGLLDSVIGIALLIQLDRDEESVPINAVSHTPTTTVLQQRRLRERATVRRPAEQILRQRVPVWKRILQCLGVNVAIIAAYQVFVFVITWMLAWVNPDVVEIALKLLALPAYFITRILMALWFSDIAGACWRSLKQPEPLPVDIKISISDIVVSLFLGLVFLIQSILVVHLPVPIIAGLLSFIHMTLLNSMYCFEYLWASRSISLPRRIDRIQRRWPYFIGFGTPLTILSTMTGNFLIDGCIFACFFPIFIISTYKADWERKSEVPCVHIFSPSKILTDKFFRVVSNYAAV